MRIEVLRLSNQQDCALTVVTPTFNAIAHIAGCLDNVQQQDRDDVQHLVVDGGSKDGTVEFVQARMKSDARVSLLYGPDRGQAHAMNKGVIGASGDVIGCLNVDDRYAPGTLAHAIEQFKTASSTTFLWGACQVNDALNGTTWTQRPGTFETWRMLLGWHFAPHPVNPCAYFYHRALHFSAGLFDEVEHYAFDVDFLLRAAQHVDHIVCTDRLLGVYNLDPGTKTYEDMASGANVARMQTLYARYVPTLSFVERLKYDAARVQLGLRERLPR